jgi:hypothetical protein
MIGGGTLDGIGWQHFLLRFQHDVDHSITHPSATQRNLKLFQTSESPSHWPPYDGARVDVKDVVQTLQNTYKTP